MSSDNEEKTVRIGLVCGTAVILGIILAVVKTNACSGAGTSITTPTCHDEFHEFNSRYSVQCDPGAVAEVVNAPPAPKSGILCHCPTHPVVPPAPSASAKP